MEPAEHAAEIAAGAGDPATLRFFAISLRWLFVVCGVLSAISGAVNAWLWQHGARGMYLGAVVRDVLFATLFFVQAYAARPRLVVEIGPRWLIAPQARVHSPAVVEWQDLTGLAWYDGKYPTFETRHGRRFMVDLSGLRRGDRRRVQEILAERLPFYRARRAAGGRAGAPPTPAHA